MDWARFRMDRLHVLSLLSVLAAVRCSDVRSLDGVGNHFAGDTRGAVSDTYLRVLPRNSSRRTNAALPSPRLVSNAVLDAWLPHHAAKSSSVAGGKAKSAALTGLFAFYGQWLTTDVTHAKTNSSEKWPIAVPRCDVQLDPDCSGTRTLGFSRTVRRPGGDAGEQYNGNTGFIDAEQVYGNNKARSDALRAFKGGLLRSRTREGTSTETYTVTDTAAEEYLPMGDEPTAAGHGIGNPMQLPSSALYFTGSERANVVPQILAFHVVFLREHNRRARELALLHPQWDDEKLFQGARKWIIGLSQSIMYNEYLPSLLGAPMPAYNRGSNPAFDHSIPWNKGFSGKAEDQTMDVKSGEVLKFVWSGGHNVYLMKGKAAFDACDFAGATNLGAASPVYHTMGTATAYFACEVGSHCKSGQKLSAMSNTKGGVAVTHTGFLVDLYCWDKPNHKGVDGANLGTEPEQHTVHCLRDIQRCIDGGYALLEKKAGATSYSLKYKLDATGNANILKLIKTTKSIANFQVTATGTASADGLTLNGATFVEGGGETSSQYGSGYDASVSPQISNSFAAAALRYGHSEIPTLLYRLSSASVPTEWGQGHVPLREVFFRPDRCFKDPAMASSSSSPTPTLSTSFALEGPTASATANSAASVVDATLQGMVSTSMAKIDTSIVDDVRTFLFSVHGMPGGDLAARNIQRGRDHDLPSFNDAVRALGLGPAPANYAELTGDAGVAAALQVVYGDGVEDVDLWVGGLAEGMYGEKGGKGQSHVGPVFTALIVEQMERSRAADRLWYEGSSWTEAERGELRKSGGMAGLLARTSAVKTSSPFALAETNDAQCAAPSGNNGAGDIHVTSDPPRSIRWVYSQGNAPEGGGGSILFTLTLPVNSWLGLGWGAKEDGMVESDMMIAVAHADGKTVRVEDCWSMTFESPKLDTDLASSNSGLAAPPDGKGGHNMSAAYNNDLELLNYTVTAGVATLTVRRLVDTGDTASDSPIRSGEIDVNIAHGSIDSGTPPMWKYHQQSGRRVMQLIPWGESGNRRVLPDGLDSRRSMQLIHGVMMSIIWGINICLGVFVARYTRHRTWWFGTHRFLMSMSTVITWPTMYIATRMVRVRFNSAHAYIGTFITAIISLQAFLGTFSVAIKRMQGRHGGQERMTSSSSAVDKLKHKLVDLEVKKHLTSKTRFAHRVIGRALVALAVLQMCLGVQLLRGEEAAEGMSLLEQMMFGWGIGLIVLFTYFEIELQFGLVKGKGGKVKHLMHCVFGCCCKGCAKGGDQSSKPTDQSRVGRRATVIAARGERGGVPRRRAANRKLRQEILSDTSQSHLESWPYSEKNAAAYEQTLNFYHASEASKPTRRSTAWKRASAGGGDDGVEMVDNPMAKAAAVVNRSQLTGIREKKDDSSGFDDDADNAGTKGEGGSNLTNAELQNKVRRLSTELISGIQGGSGGEDAAPRTPEIAQLLDFEAMGKQARELRVAMELAQQKFDEVSKERAQAVEETKQKELYEDEACTSRVDTPREEWSVEEMKRGALWGHLPSTGRAALASSRQESVLEESLEESLDGDSSSMTSDLDVMDGAAGGLARQTSMETNTVTGAVWSAVAELW